MHPYGNTLALYLRCVTVQIEPLAGAFFGWSGLQKLRRYDDLGEAAYKPSINQAIILCAFHPTTPAHTLSAKQKLTPVSQLPRSPSRRHSSPSYPIGSSPARHVQSSPAVDAADRKSPPPILRPPVRPPFRLDRPGGQGAGLEELGREVGIGRWRRLLVQHEHRLCRGAQAYATPAIDTLDACLLACLSTSLLLYFPFFLLSSYGMRC